MPTEEVNLLFPDVFIPDCGICLNVSREEFEAFLGVEVDHFNAERAEPIDAALESAAFSDDDFAKAELAYEPAAIPAGSQRCNHNQVAIAALAAGISKGVGFSVKGWIAILHAAIVAGPDEPAACIEYGRADGNAAFSESFAGFFKSDRQHGGVVERIAHARHYTYAPCLA